MQGVEKSHCNAAINAVLAAYMGVMATTVGEGRRKIASTFGKPDTMVVDGTPEILLTAGLRAYDKQAIIITEEIGTDDLAKLQPDIEDPRRFRTIFISDPMDRSNVFATFLEQFPLGAKIGDVLKSGQTKELWEQKCGFPSSITGASSAITCVRRGLPIFTVMVNYLTQRLLISCGAGNYDMPIPSDSKEITEIDLDVITENASKIMFRSLDVQNEGSMRRFVTFTGKAGYAENLVASHLMTDDELKANLHFSLPGGPLRIAYLSTFQPEDCPVGFILANGEKIGEWIHWLPFVRFAADSQDASEPAFSLFEVYQEELRIKDTALMATPPAYSIFQPSSFAGGKIVIDVRRVSAFVNPSKIRSTLLVVPKGNQAMALLTRQYGHRRIEFANDW